MSNVVTANATLTTEQFLAITNYNHPAVTEISSFSSVNLGFLPWEDYIARRDHAVTLWHAEEARKRKIGLARAKARREAEIKQAFALEGRVRLVIKTKQAA